MSEVLSMDERKYFVTVNNIIIAEGMSLDDALILVRAEFDAYPNEHLILAIEESMSDD